MLQFLTIFWTLVAIIGVLIGGAVGVALGKWPARSVLRSPVKGVAFGMGISFGMGLFVVFALFIMRELYIT